MKTPNKCNICRLCAVNFENGSSLFELDEDKEIYSLIDEYLPVKITKGEKLPTKICVECKTNVQNVVKFFGSVISGQKLLLKETEQYIKNYVTTFKETAVSTVVDDEIRKNLKKIFTATACKENANYIYNYEHGKPQVEISPTPNSRTIDNHPITKPDSTAKDFKYPENGRKYYTRETNKEDRSKNNIIDSEDERSPSKVFICDICGKKFSHRSSVLYHFHTKHGENQLFNCSECNKKFSSTRLLKRHFKRIHSVIRMSECIQCHATFITEDLLKNHLKTCKQNIVECKHCKKPYKFRNKHECQKEERGRDYRCKVCEKTFKYSSNLYRHQKLHSTERPYQCAKCNRKFPTVSRLKMHENEHNKEYSYKCNVCQKTFVNNRILRVHLRRHTRVFPFQCDICCKGFPDKCSIVKHVRVHTGERPYSCDSCEKTFADQSNFLRHKKAHDKIQNPARNPKPDSIFKKTLKSTSPKTKLRMEIDYSSMTYSNDNSNNNEKYFPFMSHFLAETQSNSNDSEKHVGNNSNGLFKTKIDLKKTLYANNSAKRSLYNPPRPGKNLAVIQSSLPSPTMKLVNQNKEKSSPLILKSTNKPNSYVIVKKENNTPISNDPTKVIVIRSRNKKSKFIMQKPLEPVVKKELPDVLPRKEDGSNLVNRCDVKNKQNQLPELYSCEKMPPSPTSEYIDVEDLVATFTPNISFEEIGDLNDLVNTKIDL